MNNEKTFIQTCKELLNKQWVAISKQIESENFTDPILPDEPKLKRLIFDCLTSKIKTYHYVLPTQVLAKCINSKLDCHSIQTAYNKPGAFDARTIAHDVIIPFDQANHNVLGGSTEPYVNNPACF